MALINILSEQIFMNILGKIKKTVSQTCVIYTVILTSVYTLGAFVNSSWVPTVQMVYSCLGFSLVLALLNLFLFSDKLVMPLRLLIHFAVSSLIFYLLFVVWGGYQSNGGSVITALLIYVFAYILCAAIVAAYRYLTSESVNAKKGYSAKFNKPEEEYKSQFGSGEENRKRG